MVPTVAGVDLESTPRRRVVCDMLADEYARALALSMELMETEIHRLDILG